MLLACTCRRRLHGHRSHDRQDGRCDPGQHCGGQVCEPALPWLQELTAARVGTQFDYPAYTRSSSTKLDTTVVLVGESCRTSRNLYIVVLQQCTLACLLAGASCWPSASKASQLRLQCTTRTAEAPRRMPLPRRNIAEDWAYGTNSHRTLHLNLRYKLVTIDCHGGLAPFTSEHRWSRLLANRVCRRSVLTSASVHAAGILALVRDVAPADANKNLAGFFLCGTKMQTLTSTSSAGFHG